MTTRDYPTEKPYATDAKAPPEHSAPGANYRSYDTETGKWREAEPFTAYDCGGHPAARGFSQVFRIHPTLGLTFIAGDWMISGIDFATLGISAPVLWAAASIVTGVCVYMGQKHWMKTDSQTAFIQALCLSFLMALPTPLPSFLTVPSAIAGAVQLMRKGKD